MKRFGFIQNFDWRILLLRILVNAIALLVTAGVVPNIYFVDRRFVILLWMAVVLGVVNALVKPVVQFLTLRFIFVTYGVVVVLVNAGLLWFLSILFPSLFVVDGLPWALVGGVIIGLLSSFLESLLGVTAPIVPETNDAVRQRIRSRAQGLPSAIPQAAPAALALSEEPVPSLAVVGLPSVPEPAATGTEGGIRSSASEGPVLTASAVEDTTPLEARANTAQEASVLDNTGSEE